MLEVTQYSAADLVKRSAAQILYLSKKRQEIISKRMENGTAFQSKIVKDSSLSNIVADEMRGCHSIKIDNTDIEIFYCIDMIKDGCFYEIKSVLDEFGNPTTEYPEWYLNSSLLQCAFYKALLMIDKVSRLYTPKFRLKQGYKRSSCKIDSDNDYYLIFGDIAKYKIEVTDAKKIVDFYKKKIKSMTDFDSARSFDEKNKFKEYNKLKKYFNVVKID